MLNGLDVLVMGFNGIGQEYTENETKEPAPSIWGTSEDRVEQDSTSFDDLDLFDIDAALAKQEADLQFQESKCRMRASTWRKRLDRWGSVYGLTHVNWANQETAEWEVLERLGYTHTPLSKETRDYIIQAARDVRLSHRQEIQLTKQLANARAQLAFIPLLHEEELPDLYPVRREALQAEIIRIERMLTSDMQWAAIEKAIQFFGQDIELDELMVRDNYLIR